MGSNHKKILSTPDWGMAIMADKSAASLKQIVFDAILGVDKNLYKISKKQPLIINQL